MLARRHSTEMPRLPSFKELMHSIASQYSNSAINANQNRDELSQKMTLPALCPQRSNAVFLQDTMPINLQPLEQSRITSDTSPIARSDRSPKSASPELMKTEQTCHSSSSVATSTLSEENTNSVKSEDENAPTSFAGKRRHACKICGRSFTTSGHLARHIRVHTGERNHACPFPRCTARFARQDNCMQHYRTHLKGKGKKSRSKKV